MMKIAALTALLAGSVSAFAPSSTNGRVNTAIAAEKSAALPFMNRPALVSLKNRWLLVLISKANFTRRLHPWTSWVKYLCLHS